MAIEERIGAYIGYKRRRLYQKTLSSEYSQVEFIKATKDVNLYGCALGHPVCSRSTLHKIENGFHTQESQLLDFFLQKLDCKQQIMDHELTKTNNVLNHYLDRHYLIRVNDWLKDFKRDIKNQNHQLVIFDTYVLNVINRWLNTNTIFSIQTIMHMLDIIKVINPRLRKYCVEFICYEIYFNKKHWEYAQSVIERFRVLNINSPVSLWFIQVFNFSYYKKSIPFPNDCLSSRYHLLIQKYNWYMNQPLFQFESFYFDRKKLIHKNKKLIKYEPYPFCLSVALLESQ